MSTAISLSESRPNPAPIQVIGLGMGRTGTMSLWKALDILGFGPAYHPMQTPTPEEDYFIWADIIEGKDNSPATFDKILRGYKSVVDSPIAVMAKEAYTAYPNAKYILTVRDPEKWEYSVKTTVLEAHRRRKDLNSVPPPNKMGMYRWFIAWSDVYHKGRLATHAKEEFEEHNERIKNIIPTDKLLIFNVAEGWDRLVEFLGVPKPDVPFPHLNDSVKFLERMDDRLKLRKMCEIDSNRSINI